MPKADVVWETLSHGSRKTRLANKEKIEILNEKVVIESWLESFMFTKSLLDWQFVMYRVSIDQIHRYRNKYVVKN